MYTKPIKNFWSFTLGSFVCSSFARAFLQRPTQCLSCCQKLLSNYRNPFRPHILATWLHDCSKEPKSLRWLQIFPCPLQTTIRTKSIFLHCPEVILSFWFFSPLAQSVLSLFIEHIHILRPILGRSSLNHRRPRTQTWGLAFHYVSLAHQFA